MPGSGLLGLFPSFETVGGVQASGGVAWRGIMRSTDAAFGERYLVSYEPDGVQAGLASDRRKLVVSSRIGAAVAAIRHRWPVKLVLVWHLDLLKYLVLLRPSGARTVLFLHGIEAWRRPTAAVRMLLPRVDLFLANSDHTWARFASRVPTCVHRPHRTVHLGIGQPVRCDVADPSGTPIALMVGRLARAEDYKGHREVIAAWPYVAQRVPGAELWIVGDGDLRGDLEAAARQRDLGNLVRFMGTLPESAKEDALIRSRCLLMPSLAEGFGLVYLEAMRLGRPCLVSTVDAGREVVDPPEAGLAADPGEPGQVVDAICRLLTPGAEWDGWSHRARHRYEQHFTAAHFESRLVTALSDVARGNGSAA
jgi:glycosyltransferase involved in cell wall biosynthesis